MGEPRSNFDLVFNEVLLGETWVIYRDDRPAAVVMPVDEYDALRSGAIRSPASPSTSRCSTQRRPTPTSPAAATPSDSGPPATPHRTLRPLVRPHGHPQ